jgi:hypothetical protein
MSFIFARVCEFQEHFSENKGERIAKRREYTAKSWFLFEEKNYLFQAKNCLKQVK